MDLRTCLKTSPGSPNLLDVLTRGYYALRAFCLADHLVGWLKLKLIMILCFSSQTQFTDL